ncbi:MAG: hypothetical protein KF901_28125 [Myxococcales bacterium]|nr:hypothetical protein [Myxococcales bacterium]
MADARARWADLVARATRGDTDLAGLAGWVVADAALGRLASRPLAERERVRRALAPGAPSDGLEARVVAVAIALLREPSADPATLPPTPADLRAPTPRRLRALVEGALDPIAAATCAGWVLADPRRRATLRVLAEEAGVAEEVALAPIPIAAASGRAMRDPQEGVSLGAHEAGLEAVLFARPSPRRLALYASAAEAIRGEAVGVTTEDIAPGYWLGRLERSVRGELALRIRLGERTFVWNFSLKGP